LINFIPPPAFSLFAAAITAERKKINRTMMSVKKKESRIEQRRIFSSVRKTSTVCIELRINMQKAIAPP
jgi:hypothetical protein